MLLSLRREADTNIKVEKFILDSQNTSVLMWVSKHYHSGDSLLYPNLLCVTMLILLFKTGLQSTRGRLLVETGCFLKQRENSIYRFTDFCCLYLFIT